MMLFLNLLRKLGDNLESKEAEKLLNGGSGLGLLGIACFFRLKLSTVL